MLRSCRNYFKHTLKNAIDPQFNSSRYISSKYDESKHYDIIIVGGGAAGLSLAASIGQNSILREKRVLLLDAAPKFKGYNENVYSNRVYALNRGTVNLLKAIGAWDTVKSIRCREVKHMRVWESHSDAMITFNSNGSIKDLAYIVENDVLLFSILEKLEKCDNVEMKTGTKIDRISLQQDETMSNEVHLTTGEHFTAELLVGADGAKSIVRQQMNIDNFELSYNQMGLVATVQLDGCENNFEAWQRFLPNGVIALLPLTNDLSSIVWSTEIPHFKHLMQCNETDFIDAVNNAFINEFEKHAGAQAVMNSLGNVLNYSENVRQLPPQAVGLYEKSRAGFPLGFAHASSYVSHGAVLIGDAAHRIHPLAGLGLNLGMGDVTLLTEILAKTVFNGSRLNNLNYLREYEAKRLKSNVPIMLGVHGIQRLYNTKLSLAVVARSIGLQFTQQMAPLKKFFLNNAMGK